MRKGISEPHRANNRYEYDNALRALRRIEEQLEAVRGSYEETLVASAKWKDEAIGQVAEIDALNEMCESLREQKEALRTAVLARCFMCADGIARQDCEPFDMHNYTVSGLHSWRGNDRMFCGLTQQEAEAAGVSNPQQRGRR